MTTPSVIASEARQSIPASQPILPWLAMLAHLFPPKATLLIGAGAGTSPWVKHLQTANHPNVTLIEADEAKATRLKTATQNQPSWQVKQHVIAQHTAPTQFFTASLQTESGLLEPEGLRSLWPNLKTTHQQTLHAISLAELQADAQTPANWLLLDCLPALPIIQGTFQDAAQTLAHFDVIAARVLLQDTAPHRSTATVDLLQLALQAQGFMCVAIEASRHPAIGHALFVRDTAAQAAQKTAETAQAAAHAAAEQLAAERQKHSEQLQQFKDAAEQAQDLAAQESEKAKAAAAKQFEERAAQVQQLIQAKAAADKLATERQQQLDQLQTLLKQAAEQAQAATQEAEKAKAAASAAAAKATAEATAAAAKQAEERAAQVQQLTQAKAAADKLATERQQQLDQLQTQLKQATEQAQAAAQEAEKAKVSAAAQATQQAQTAAEAQAIATTAIAAATIQAEERSAQVQLLTQAKAAADKLLADRMAQIQAHDQRLQQLQAHSAETDHLNSLLQAEVAKAEAQIGLLKELLFREQTQ